MIRTRFAPSPTGRLHLGNVRTAVFNWLFARHHGGVFVLRIEDTDVERNISDSEQGLMEDLRWLGLEWNEGPDVGGPFGPYRQSERSDLYRGAAQTLLERDLCYACYCTPEELEADVKDLAGGAVARYPGRCRDLTEAECERFEAEGRSPAIRFRLPEVPVIEIVDEVRGSITFPGNDFDDFVILRSDGRPTYNFAVVVDDAAMEISHVIRGAGHLSNTPKQALLFDALGRPRPVFAHLPTVLSPEGGKLSKRTGAAAVSALRDDGYHPDGVVNYLSLLGWSPGDDEEVLERDELVSRISLERVGASDTTYDPEKLRWVSARHIAMMDVDVLTAEVESRLDRERIPLEGPALRSAVVALRSRLSTFGDFEAYASEFLFPDDAEMLARAREEIGADPEQASVVAAVAAELGNVVEWESDALGRVVRDAGKKEGARGRALFHPVRKALSGQESGPDLGLVMEALGRAEVLRRLGSIPGGSPV